MEESDREEDEREGEDFEDGFDQKVQEAEDEGGNEVAFDSAGHHKITIQNNGSEVERGGVGQKM